jgi:hypothetical protein
LESLAETIAENRFDEIITRQPGAQRGCDLWSLHSIECFFILASLKPIWSELKIHLEAGGQCFSSSNREIKMRNSLSIRPVQIAIALAGLMALAGTAYAQSTQNFTFQNAEFAPGEQGAQAAKSFVATQLTRGLAMNAAVAKVENAGAKCKAPSSAQNAITCVYSILARPTGGDLGENIWSVTLTPGSSGTLQSADLEISRVGMPGDS